MSGIKYEMKERYDRLEPSPALLRRTERMMAQEAHRSDPQKRRLYRTAASIAAVCLVLCAAVGMLLFGAGAPQDQITPLRQGDGQNGSTLSTMSEPGGGTTTVEAEATNAPVAIASDAQDSTLSEPKQTVAGAVQDSTLSEPMSSTMSEILQTLDNLVYRSADGQAFHRTADCSAAVDVRETSVATALAESALPCTMCYGNINVYIDEDGEHYHLSEICEAFTPGSYTTISTLRYAQEETKAKPCVKCAGMLCLYYANPNGAYFHADDSCMGMTGAWAISREDAEARRIWACPECLGVYSVPDDEHYHVVAFCGGMKNAQIISAEEAALLGQTLCAECSGALEDTGVYYHTNEGMYYHADKECGMRYVIQTTRNKAVAMGQTACPVCAGGTGEIAFTIGGEAVQLPLEIEQEGVIMRIEAMEISDLGLNFQCNVISEREEDVFVTLECELLLPDGCTSKEAGKSNYVSVIIDGEEPNAPVLYEIHAGTKMVVPFGVSYDDVRRDIEEPYGLKLILRAYEAADGGEIELRTEEDGLDLFLDDKEQMAMIRSHEIGVIDEGKFGETCEQLKAQGLNSYRANLQALTESGVFRQVAEIRQDAELFRQENENELYLTGISAKLPGRTVDIEEMYLSPELFEARYTVKLDDTPYQELEEGYWQNELFWEKILFYLVDGDGNYIYTLMEIRLDEDGNRMISSHGQREFELIETEDGLMGFEVWLKNEIDLDEMPEEAVFAPFRAGTNRYEGNHQRRFEQLYKDTAAEECFRVELKEDRISLGDRVVEIVYAGLNDGGFQSSDMQEGDGTMSVQYKVYAGKSETEAMTAYFPVRPNGEIFEKEQYMYAPEAETDDAGRNFRRMENHIVLEGKAAPEYIVFVPFDSLEDMALAEEDERDAKRETLKTVGAEECFVIWTGAPESPKPLSAEMLEGLRGN